MLNEEKIRLMTGIAMFEKKTAKEMSPAIRYFKSDYIGSHMIHSFLSYTFTCALCAALWGLYSLEDLLNTVDIDSLISLCWRLGIYYGAGLLAYLAITWSVCVGRYELAVRELRMYQAKLRRLEKKYDSKAGTGESREERPL